MLPPSVPVNQDGDVIDILWTEYWDRTWFLRQTSMAKQPKSLGHTHLRFSQWSLLDSNQ